MTSPVGATTGEYVTRNLSLAAYLQECGGLNVRKAGRNPQTGDFEFVLDDSGGTADTLAVAWANSSERRFEQAVMALKVLMRSGATNGRR